MAKYNKIGFKDHILNPDGSVNQQGTPLSAGNFGKMEEGIAEGMTFLASELATTAAHSGVLDYVAGLTNGAGSGIPIGGLGYHSSNPLTVYVGISNFLVAGNVLKITSLQDIKVPATPSTGERDDLVFLESWRDEATQEWKNRVRTVAGVNFTKYPEGLFDRSVQTDYADAVLAQGGNAAPVTVAGNYARDAFCKNWAGVGKDNFSQDKGLYVAGDGTTASKGTLKTYDGYVYAIPLFRVKRRNNGGYSVANPAGARDFAKLSATISNSTAGSINLTGTATITMASASDLAKLRKGDKIYQTGGNYVGIINEIVGNDGISTSATINVTTGASYGMTNSTHNVEYASDRPDGLYANIVAERDITDLRRRTYLTGVDKDALMDNTVDALLRSVLETKDRKQMVKTYHGVRKTPVDANTVFYASLDGTNVAEVGGTLGNGSPTYVPGPTGLAASFAGGATLPIPLTSDIQSEGSLEFWVDVRKLYSFTDYRRIAAISNNAAVGINLYFSPNKSIYAEFYHTSGGTYTSFGGTPITADGPQFKHTRLTWKVVNGSLTVKWYTDGIRMGEATWSNAQNFRGPYTHISFGHTSALVLADVAVSKLDRADVFATLPADYIAGKARIMPAFNNQRQVFSDALTSQRIYQIAKVQSATQEKGITVTKGTGVNTAAWEAGDKIKVKGRAGEVITGVIDGGTGLARIITYVSNTEVIVDDVSKLAVNDSIRLALPDGSGSFTTVVSAIDTNTKKVTTQNTFGNNYVGGMIYDITASNSSPAVVALIGGVVTTVTGTWANLGTNEAEFTLGALPAGLDVEDIQIEYSLNMLPGQGGLPEVYTATLAGEFKGQKLVKGNLAMLDDFKDKVAGSMTENGHIIKIAYDNGLLAPSAFGTELTQEQYNTIKNLDNTLLSLSTTTGNQRIQVCISYDLIFLATKKYGADFFKGCLTTAEKVQRLKATIGTTPGLLTWNAWVRSTAPNNSATTAARIWRNGAWVGSTGVANGAISKVTYAQGDAGSLDYIDANGFAHMLLFNDPTDGVTASTMLIDTANVEVGLNAKTGYDLLVPENPRRDAGLSNAFYVRKETEEVEALVPTDENGQVVTYGDFVPYQGVATGSRTGVKVLAVGNFILTTIGTAAKDVTVPPAYVGLVTQIPREAGTSFALYGASLKKRTGGYMPFDNIVTLGIDQANMFYSHVPSRPSRGLAGLVGSTVDFNYRGSNIADKGLSDSWGVNPQDGTKQYSLGIPFNDSEYNNVPAVAILPFLVEYNSEVYVVLTTTTYKGSMQGGITNGAVWDMFRIPGRPLIKGA